MFVHCSTVVYHLHVNNYIGNFADFVKTSTVSGNYQKQLSKYIQVQDACLSFASQFSMKRKISYISITFQTTIIERCRFQQLLSVNSQVNSCYLPVKQSANREPASAPHTYVLRNITNVNIFLTLHAYTSILSSIGFNIQYKYKYFFATLLTKPTQQIGRKSRRVLLFRLLFDRKKKRERSGVGGRGKRGERGNI